MSRARITSICTSRLAGHISIIILDDNAKAEKFILPEMRAFQVKCAYFTHLNEMNDTACGTCGTISLIHQQDLSCRINTLTITQLLPYAVLTLRTVDGDYASMIVFSVLTIT